MTSSSSFPVTLKWEDGHEQQLEDVVGISEGESPDGSEWLVTVEYIDGSTDTYTSRTTIAIKAGTRTEVGFK